MDDIRIDDDPRKQSAKKIKKMASENKDRGFGGFLFDWIIKSLLVCAILAADFTLFANAGNYSIFTNYGNIAIEAGMVYAGIAVFSFVATLIMMIILPLDNLFVAAILAVTGVGIINQFATFDKQSGLLILFGEFLSNDVNAMLYRYSHWIIAGAIFVISYIILKLLKRSLLLYMTLAVVGLCAWIMSESYFSPSKPLFRQLANNPSTLDSGANNNIIFLSFRDLTSINNLKNLSEKDNSSNAKKALQNALGVLAKNKFTIYPNAMVERDSKAFDNLIAYYNSDGDEKNNGVSVVTQNAYFDFGSLHPDTKYLDKSSLFENLKKQGYSINAYQINGIDICKLDNGKAVTSCYEKINYPILMPSDRVPLTDRVIILASQWIVSMGFIEDINPVLGVARYVLDDIKPYSFYVDKLNAFNSFNVFDMILADIDRKNGKQAYFALIDLPADTFVYDEYCSIKHIRQWIGDNNMPIAQASLSAKQNAYFDQSNCMYGYLNKFMKQLEINGLDKNTTVVVAGVSAPALVNNLGEKDFYRKMQASQQIGLAIKPAKASNYNIDYSVCDAKQIIGSHFFSKKLCKNFASIKTTDKNLEYIKNMVKKDYYDDAYISAADKQSTVWFSDWAKNVGYSPRRNDNSDNVVQPSEEVVENDVIDTPIELAQPKVMKEEIHDEEEVALESIAKVASEASQALDNVAQGVVINNTQDEESNENTAEEVIPSTLFDNGIVVEENEETKEPEPNPEPVKQIQQDNPKQGYDLNQVINEAKKKAQEDVAASQQKVVEVKKAASNTQQAIAKNVTEKAATAKKSQQQAIKNVLVAPKTNGKQLSPEELKKQYHEMLRQAQASSGNTIRVEIVD